MKPVILKKFSVVRPDGTVQYVIANFAFVNDGSLVFRLGERGETEVVAFYAPGGWHSYTFDGVAAQ